MSRAVLCSRARGKELSTALVTPVCHPPCAAWAFLARPIPRASPDRVVLAGAGRCRCSRLGRGVPGRGWRGRGEAPAARLRCGCCRQSKAPWKLNWAAECRKGELAARRDAAELTGLRQPQARLRPAGRRRRGGRSRHPLGLGGEGSMRKAKRKAGAVARGAQGSGCRWHGVVPRVGRCFSSRLWGGGCPLPAPPGMGTGLGSARGLRSAVRRRPLASAPRAADPGELPRLQEPGRKMGLR